MTEPRFYWTPARRIDGWWWSYVKSVETGAVMAECRASVASSAERDAKAWIRIAEEDAA